MAIPMGHCKRMLALIWLVGFGVLFVTLLLQSIQGHYGDKASEAWGWLLPTILPTLSLIIGITASDALNKPKLNIEVDRFTYRLAKNLSIAYLIVVSTTIFLQPLSSWTPLELMKQSNLWLGPLQGIVLAVLGVFFVNKPSK